MSRVFIGVGHGGGDPGAVSGGMQEKDINLEMALAMREELARHGVETEISRTGDRTVGLAEEIRLCGAFRPDLAVEVHNNAGGGEGFEVFRQSNGHAAASLALAACIEKRVIAIGQRSRGVKKQLNSQGLDWFGWLRENACPAVLCEGAFLDNAADRARIDTPEKRRTFGAAYAHGVLDYLGIAVREDRRTLYGVVQQVIALADREAAERHAARLNAADGREGWYKVIEIEGS